MNNRQATQRPIARRQPRHSPCGTNRFLFLLWAIAFAGGAGRNAQGVEADSSTPDMSYLDNGTVRIGVDLNLGGAITYLADSRRLVNI